MVLHTNSVRRPSGRADKINLIRTGTLNPFQKICYKVLFRNLAPSRGPRLCRPYFSYWGRNHSPNSVVWKEIVVFTFQSPTRIPLKFENRGIHIFHFKAWIKRVSRSLTSVLHFYQMTKWKYGFVNCLVLDVTIVHLLRFWVIPDVFNVIILIFVVPGNSIQLWRRVRKTLGRKVKMAHTMASGCLYHSITIY